MKQKFKFLTTTLLLSALTGCGSSDSPFTQGSSSSSNIVSAKNFALVFDELNPNVFEVATGITTNGINVVITVNAGDRFQARVSGGTVFFRTEIGLLDSNSCQLVNGTCSVTWSSDIVPGDIPADNINTVTAYTIGEEGFTDLNSNGVFDDGDLFTHDISDPFLDLSHDGNNPGYNAGVDALIVDSIFNAADSAYSGAGCNHSTTSLCASSTTTYIYDTQEMNLAF